NIKRHLLIAFILKWFGGIPVNNLNSQYNTTLKLIESVYLENFQFANVAESEFTDHKDFMNKLNEIIEDNPRKEQLKKLEKILNDNINDKVGFEEKERKSKPYIFISHSSKDASIVKEFTDKILQLILR